jgi:hypothetical protein
MIHGGNARPLALLHQYDAHELSDEDAGLDTNAGRAPLLAAAGMGGGGTASTGKIKGLAAPLLAAAGMGGGGSSVFGAIRRYALSGSAGAPSDRILQPLATDPHSIEGAAAIAANLKRALEDAGFPPAKTAQIIASQGEQNENEASILSHEWALHLPAFTIHTTLMANTNPDAFIWNVSCAPFKRTGRLGVISRNGLDTDVSQNCKHSTFSEQ